MPDGSGGSPEILKTQGSPRAGNKGGKAQTEEEKAEEKRKGEEAVQKKIEEFRLHIARPRKELLDEATKPHRDKIESFQKKVQEKPIGAWEIGDLRSDLEAMLVLDEELAKGDAEPELQSLVQDIAGYCFFELAKRPEFVLPDVWMDRLREMQAVEPIMAPVVHDIFSGGNNAATVAEDVLETIDNQRRKGKRVTPQEARQLWTEYYSRQGKNIETLPRDERQTLEIAIAQGIAPESHREIGKVLENALLDEKERKSRAVDMLKRPPSNPVTEEQKNAIIDAHRIGLGTGVYGYTREQIAQKAQILKDAGFSKEERRMLLETGIAGAPVDIDPAAPGELQNIATEINRRPETRDRDDDTELRSAYLHDQIKRVRDLIDRGTFGTNPTDPGVVQAHDFITTLEERTEAVAQAEGVIAERREERRQQQREVAEYVPTREEIDNQGFDAAQYATADPRIRNIANAIDGVLHTDPPTVTSSYLREQLRTLIPIMLPDDLTDVMRDQGNRLRGDIERLKRWIDAENNRITELSSRGTLYGEIRMSEREKTELVRLAIQAGEEGGDINDLGSEASMAWRELEERFNRNFAQADVNSNDQWREALGDAGSYEIREFLRTLTNASESKTSSFPPAQQEAIRTVLRRLKQEMDLREYLHSLSYHVNTNAGAEEIIKGAAQFRGQDADVAFGKRGVAQVLHMYENAMLEVMVKNGGFLPGTSMINNPDGTYGEVEKIVLDQAKRAKEIGALPRDIADWEIRRAISLARGMGIVTGRFFEIVADHGIPKTNPLNSWWANSLVKNIAFFQQVTRFDVGKERNAILGYRLEGGGGPWSTSELEKYRKMGQAKILDALVNEGDDDRLVQMKNPFHIGSIFTQTGWRWRGDKVNMASAASHLLEEDPFNPIIGVGLQIEAQRGALESTDLLDKADREEARRLLGVDVKTKGDRAKEIIHRGLRLSSEISPLKLFNGLTRLRRDVLMRHYGTSVQNREGQIFITNDQLRDDIKALSLVQEHMQRERINAYNRYLASDELRIFKERLARGEVTESDRPRAVLPEPRLQYRVLITSVDPVERARQEDQARRVEQLAKHIEHEFTKDGNNSHMHRVMHNLEHKGWKVPWVLGTDDIPYDALKFSAIPGDTIKRRWDADIGPVVQTAGLYGKFIVNMSEFQSQHDIVKAMTEIHNTLSGHDGDVAQDTIRYLAEGVGKFYKKDWTTRLPLGIGKLEGYLGGKASYAQVVYGRGQMAWDELDMQAFLHHIHAAGIVNHHQMEELKIRLGAENYQLIWAAMRSGIPMFLLGFIYMMLLEQMEQAKKSA